MPGIGVDTGYYSPEAVSAGQVDAVRAEAGLAPPDRALLMVAEFSPRKNHEQALRAFALLGRPRARLLLAGYGPLMDPMRALARELGIAERVRFLGVRHDIRVLIKACVATVLCSRQEGLPRSVMESLSMGVPAIGTRIRGIRELLEPGAGHLVPLGDAGALAEAMERVLARPEEAARMGRKGREQMRATYDLQHILASHADLYADVLGAGTAQTPEPMPREVSTHAVHRA
jgi:glycosyltransferase involved in cell wall biosynthesis